MSNIDRYRDSSSQRSWRPLLRQVDDLFTDLSRSFFRDMPMGRSAVNCDVEEKSDCYLLSFDMPGVPKDNIDIDVSGNVLTVRGERSSVHGKSSEEGGRTREFSSYVQSMTLPADVSADQIEANYENGVLSVVVPKSDQARTRKVKVGELKEGGFFKKLMGGTRKGETGATSSVTGKQLDS